MTSVNVTRLNAYVALRLTERTRTMVSSVASHLRRFEGRLGQSLAKKVSFSAG